MTTDVALNRTKGYFDFDWTEDGDIDTGQTLDTQILMSIFCEVRAAYHEVPEASKRRGWVGNRDGFEQGSKSWEFEQERLTGSVLAELGVVIRNGLQWLIDDNMANSVTVGQPFLRNGQVVVQINLGRDESVVEKKFFELWNNTGSGLNF